MEASKTPFPGPRPPAPGPSALSLRIDGEYVPAQEGQTILEVARAAGKYIPTLCWLEGIASVGACRLCIVEIAGVGRLLPACTTPVQDGMSVTTHSEKLAHYRRIALEFLFSERNHVCAVCVSNNHCELQAMAQRLGVTSVRYPYSYPRLAVDSSHPRYVCAGLHARVLAAGEFAYTVGGGDADCGDFLACVVPHHRLHQHVLGARLGIVFPR